MRELVISDVHERIDRVLRIRAQAGRVDHTYFLGDFMDTREEIPGGLLETAGYLEEVLNDPDCTVHWGNHDLAYGFPLVRGLRCSGFDAFKLTIVAKAMALMRDKAKLATNTQGWTLSHAGFAKDLASDAHEPGILSAAISCLHGGMVPELLRVGRYRGGDSATGGVTWLDWDKEFEPVEGLKQIVGHTIHEEPQWNGDNLALDTKLKHYAIIEDGKVTVHEVKR